MILCALSFFYKMQYIRSWLYSCLTANNEELIVSGTIMVLLRRFLNTSVETRLIISTLNIV